MAGLQRFITYIYYYENEEKKQNTGFAKIEIRGNSCRIEVHIRGILIDKMEVTVYLFARNEKIMQGVPVGSISILRGIGDVGYLFDTRELDNYQISVGDLEGIMIPLGKGKYIASQWKEGEIREGFFRIKEKKDPSDRTEEVKNNSHSGNEEKKIEAKAEYQKSKDQSFENHIVENMEPEETETESETSIYHAPMEEERMDMAQKESEELSQMEKSEEDKNQDDDSIRATEIPLEKLFDSVGWERYYMKLKSRLPICFPFEGEEIECVQMELKDIQELPKKHWYIGNNSFLLHGFFNYHHILMGVIEKNTGNEYFIGVPGVYQNQEKIMATMFGFPDFKPKKQLEHKTGEFGYWYRVI